MLTEPQDDWSDDDDDLPTARDFARLCAVGSATRIHTERGAVAAAELSPGDRIKAKTGELVEIDWVEVLPLDAEFLARNPSLRPVLFCSGDLGDGPERNTVLSPAQQIWRDDSFRDAAELSPYPDLYKGTGVGVTYVAFNCAKPTVANADGLWISVTP